MFTATDAWIILYCFGLGICVFIVIFQVLAMCYNSSRLASEGRQDHASKQGAVRYILCPLFATYILSIAGISSAIHRLHDAQQSLCDYTYALSFAFYGSIKVANYFFFLQRAKLAQGMKPIFRDIVFDKYLPLALLLIWIIYLLWISFHPLTGEAVTSHRTGRQLCIWGAPDALQYMAVALQTIMDISWTIFFLYLFGKPMMDIQRRSAISYKKRPEKKKSKGDRKLDRAILINFVGSAICSLHTTFCALTFPLKGFFAWWPILDYAVSSICLFLMLASNRRFLVHLICCCAKCAERCIIQDTFLSKQEISTRVEHSLPDGNTAMSIKAHSAMKLNLRAPQSSQNVLSRISGGTEEFYEVSFCDDICIGKVDECEYRLHEWMGYLDGNCCYYKSKLLWTWLYFSFCCCHCYAISLYMCPLQMRGKKRKKIMNLLFASAEKLVTQKFYVGMDLEVSAAPTSVNEPPTCDGGKRERIRSGSSHIKVASGTLENISQNGDRMVTPPPPTSPDLYSYPVSTQQNPPTPVEADGDIQFAPPTLDLEPVEQTEL